VRNRCDPDGQPNVFIKEDAMKVLVTTITPGLDAEIDPRFWHAAYLTIVDTDSLQWEAVPAPGAPTVHAAGTRLGLLATHQNVGAAISNDYGPNCYIVLESAGIPAYLSGQCRTAREAIEQFKAGKLATIHAATSARSHEPAATR
jgi:predicted Fe-Mo cluster-binding NifX family protein